MTTSSLDIRGIRNIKDVDLAVYRFGDILTVASTGVTREHEELTILKSENFRLSGYLGVLLWRCRGVDVEGKRHNPLACIDGR
ncbi:hypothetical protein RRF57_009084 [Xylaria bambusicola]|uniref:Uncharacterized protein n=1 Tax=Xylaria bambusicola TaxID=326684 RepID=A0AAN7UWB8_9PEZI